MRLLAVILCCTLAGLLGYAEFYGEFLLPAEPPVCDENGFFRPFFFGRPRYEALQTYGGPATGSLTEVVPRDSLLVCSPNTRFRTLPEGWVEVREATTDEVPGDTSISFWRYAPADMLEAIPARDLIAATDPYGRVWGPFATEFFRIALVTTPGREREIITVRRQSIRSARHEFYYAVYDVRGSKPRYLFARYIHGRFASGDPVHWIWDHTDRTYWLWCHSDRFSCYRLSSAGLYPVRPRLRHLPMMFALYVRTHPVPVVVVGLAGALLATWLFWRKRTGA